MKFLKGVVLFFLTVLQCHFACAQDGRTQQMVSSTYSFIKNIEWPVKSTPFKIHVITTDNTLREEFKVASESRKVAGRDVQVSFTNYVIVPQDVDIIFVTNKYVATIPTLLDRIGGNGVLLITDRYDKQRDVMINFLNKPSGELTFEINEANITNQGLVIKPGMNELGGSEVDLAKIFKQVRDSVRAMELRAEALKEQFDTLNMNVAIAQRIGRQQQLMMAEKDQEIVEKEKRIEKQSQALDSLSVEFALSRGRLDSLTTILDAREEELAVLGEEIDKQKENVEEGNKILAEQTKRISEQNKEIAQREERLDEMSNVVNSQQSALVFLILFLVALVGFSFLLFAAYRARNRTAQKLAEQKEDLARLLDELQDTQSQLVQSEKMASLGVLTAGIAHEINNAINFVYSGIQVLSNRFDEIKPVIAHASKLDEKDKDLQNSIKEFTKEREELEYDGAQAVIDQMISSIKVGAERTTEIVKGLRIFARSETEKKTKIDIHNDLDVALLLLNSRLKESVQINKKLADKLPEIEGYKGQLSQAFLNIINNALDAVAEKGSDGKVDIETKMNESEIQVRIKDNGIGMSEADKQKIFDPFFTTKKVGAGTGLGLSITYGIVERHGGTITVNSKENEGAEFVIKLPLAS
ncbi:MAG: YfiR/HmsC family protein [Ekhidna sp.]|uniref:YfiR/HmsC family protein n=1 Tax=Ekhidna sp. TaxID=2608089 RepID=UPI0032EC8CCF